MSNLNKFGKYLLNSSLLLLPFFEYIDNVFIYCVLVANYDSPRDTTKK